MVQTERSSPGEVGLPSVSIIVPTYNRAELLPHLLAALADQDYPPALLELVLVDNSSEDETPEVVERWRRRISYPVRFIQKENRGPTASRNLGASVAKGEVLAFTDSDCLPARAWIRTAAEHLAAHPAVSILCGPMLALNPDSAGLLEMQHEETRRDTGLYPSGNLVLRRGCFREAGGFDEQFGVYRWGALVRGEDTDLVWRAKRLGHRAEFLEALTVQHLPGPKQRLTSFLLQPLTVQIIPRLLRTIPELRDTFLWHRYFVSRDHALFYLACAGLISGIRSRRMHRLLLTGPWLWDARGLIGREYRRGGLSAVVQSIVLLAQHLACCALVLAYASIRYRRLVL